MEELTRPVTNSTSLDPSVAKAAIGHVLLFLRDKAPGAHVAEFIDKVPGAKELVDAANASSDSGVTQLIEGMTSFMGHGRADLNILAGKLSNLGLNEVQIKKLLIEVLARADVLIGPTAVAKIKEILPALDERSGHD